MRCQIVSTVLVALFLILGSSALLPHNESTSVSHHAAPTATALPSGAGGSHSRSLASSDSTLSSKEPGSFDQIEYKPRVQAIEPSAASEPLPLKAGGGKSGALLGKAADLPSKKSSTILRVTYTKDKEKLAPGASPESSSSEDPERIQLLNFTVEDFILVYGVFFGIALSLAFAGEVPVFVSIIIGFLCTVFEFLLAFILYKAPWIVAAYTIATAVFSGLVVWRRRVHKARQDTAKDSVV